MKNKKILGLSLLLASVIAVGIVANNSKNATFAGTFTNENVNATVSNGYFENNASDAYLYFSLGITDCPSTGWLYVGDATYYQASNYNFGSYIQVSNDNQNFIPFSNITNGINYFFPNGQFRFGIKHESATIVQYNTYAYIKILKGCEFPSYSYCKNGGTLKKYVQEEDATFYLSSINDLGSGKTTQYLPYVPKEELPFTCVNPYNNNIESGVAGYRHTILEFGITGVDYLAKTKTPDATNRATTAYDIGNKLTINGLSIAKIQSKYPLTCVSYAHGNNYFYFVYPEDILLITDDYLVPTVHIEEGAEFMDTILPEVTLKLAGNNWQSITNESFRVTDPINIDDYKLVEFPHKYPANVAFPLLNVLPDEGAQIAFNFNSGNFDPTKANLTVIHLVLYGKTVVINTAAKTISLDGYQTFTGYNFEQNKDYLFEFEIVCGSTSTFKFAINHLLVINCSFDMNIGPGISLYTIDVGGYSTVSYAKEVPYYTPRFSYGGTSSYDFMEGDTVYNFINVVDASSLYDESISYENIEFIYEEGAVTDGKYNKGNWVLTMRLECPGSKPFIKEININVHGKVAAAKISYDDGETFEVPTGSKLTAPNDPSSYREGNYEYVFDGWYFEGARWNFDTDVVKGDMHLVSKFKAIELHYVVTVNFEGVENMASSKYSLLKGSNLPFTIFELEGATYKVYLNDVEITSLTVNEDVTIKVKYTVSYSYVEAKEATCLEDGNIGYWYSPIYKNHYFADSNGREQIYNVILPKLGHHIIHLDAKESTCAEVGNVDCYYCENCHTHYSDALGEHELIEWSKPKKEHKLTHHTYEDCSCTTDGHVEHWTCENEPGVYYKNEACTEKLDNVVIKAHGHDFRNATYEWTKTSDGYTCTATIHCTYCEETIKETKTATRVIVREASCSREGQISYSVTFDDARFSSQTKIVSIEKTTHDLVFVERVEATKDTPGVKEHYECKECNKYFIKEGETYKEVNYQDLIIEYKSSGCNGSIVSIIPIFGIVLMGALITLVKLKRKEER